MKKNSNRNQWSEQELEILFNEVSRTKGITKGISNAARKLGRTMGACSQKYYNNVQAKKDSRFLPKMQRFEFTIKHCSIVDNRLIIEI